MSAGERFTLTNVTGVSSFTIMQADQVPPRVSTWNGLQLAIKGNSNFLATLTLDNGCGLIDVTSFVTGAASIGGATTALFYQKQGFFPWKLWMNVQCGNGVTSISATFV